MKEIKTWKIWGHFFGYFLCFIIGGVISAIPRIAFGFENETGIMVFVTEIMRIPISLGLFYFYTKYVLRIPLNEETLSFSNFSLWKWGIVGISLPIVVLTIFYVSNNLVVLNTNYQLNQGVIINNILKALGMSLAAGVVEEVLFRGYLVNLLNKKYSFWIAGIAPSLFFTLIHIGAADSLVNIFQLLVAGMLVSIMFLIIYKKTGSIWNASIIHFLWNFVFLNELIAYGEIKEGVDKLIEFDLGQNELFNGGGFGIETSIPAIIVYSLTIVITWILIKGKQPTTLYNKS